jgi:hypothetical protein
MKLILKSARPRNPYVTVCRQRCAGAHRSGAQRQQARRELMREVDRLRPSP